MKPLMIVCIALFALVAAEDEWKPIDREESAKIHSTCSKENGVTTEQEQRILKKEHTDDKNVHEHVLCVFKKMGVFTEDGGYNADRLVAQYTSSHLNEKTAREIVTKCVNENNAQQLDPAPRAYQGLECLVNNRLYDLMQEAFDKVREKEVAAEEEQNEKSPKLDVYEECVDKVGISMEQIAELQRGQRTDAKETHEYILCIFKHAGIFSEETGFNVDRMVMGLVHMSVDETKARDIITKCIDNNEQKSPPVEWTYRTVMCLFDNKLNHLLSGGGKKKKE